MYSTLHLPFHRIKMTEIANLLRPLALATGGVLGVLSFNTFPAQAFSVFFGEDLGANRNSNPSAYPNARQAEQNFLANLTGVGTETFELFANGAGSGFVFNPITLRSEGEPLNLTFPGVGAAALRGGLGVGSGGTSGPFPISGSKFYGITTSANFATTVGTVPRIDFTSPVAAFGFYGTDIGSSGQQLSLQLSNGTTLTVNNTTLGAVGTALYYGFIAQNPGETFTSVTFNLSGDAYGIDNLTVGSLSQVTPRASQTSVPEPFTIIGSLLGGTAAFRMRKKLKKVAA